MSFLSSKASPFDNDVEKATSEYNTSEDWQLIMDICDKIRSAPNGAKDGLRAIMKRINHKVPHVAIQGVTLLSACINNCDKKFFLEIASRDWTTDAKQILAKAHPKVKEKFKELIQHCAEEFKNDPQLRIIPLFYKKLKADGVEFQAEGSTSSSSSATSSTKKDELSFKEDMDLAIALSLQDTENSNKSSSSKLYPDVLSRGSPTVQKEPTKVRALYDFEAAEDNELTFKAGEIIIIHDNGNQNWWKGENHRGVGLFPANFVTTDLSEPKKEKEEKEKKKKKKVRFNDSKGNTEKKQSAVKAKPVISEERLLSCLDMLKAASPTEEDDEEETIKEYEEACHNMGPLINEQIDECDRVKGTLEDLNTNFLEAISLYQSLMREPVPTPAPPPVYTPTQMQYQSGQVPSSYGQTMFQQQVQQFVRPQAQVVQQGYVGPPTNISMGPPPAYATVATSGGQPGVVENSYSSQGPSSIVPQQGYNANQPPNQAPQNTQYYAGYPQSALQEGYNASVSGINYEYGSPTHSRQQVMYSQAPVYQ